MHVTVIDDRENNWSAIHSTVTSLLVITLWAPRTLCYTEVFTYSEDMLYIHITINIYLNTQNNLLQIESFRGVCY